MNIFQNNLLLRDFINMGISEEESSSEKRRLYTINFINISTFVGSVFLTILGLIQGIFILTIQNFTLTCFSLIAVALCIKNRHTQSIYVLTSTYLLLQVFHFMIGEIYIIPTYFIVLPVLGILVLPNHYSKILLFVICKVSSVILIIASDQHLFYPILYIIISFILFYSILYFYKILEEQEAAKDLAIQQRDDLIEKLNSKNEEQILFANIMSHDLKAPIRNIQGFSSLLKRRLKDHSSTDVQEYLQFITGSTETMSTLIEDLLVYSQISSDSTTMEYIDLNILTQELLLLFEFDIIQKNIEFEFDKLPKILATKNDITTLFKNLLSNSIKYQPKDIQNHIPQITLTYEETTEFDIIYFCDNGIGIDQEYIKDLFKAFRRFHSSTEYKGTGLGMSICKKVMEKHGGMIELVKTNKQGTTFKLTFPKSASNITDIKSAFPIKKEEQLLLSKK